MEYLKTPRAGYILAGMFSAVITTGCAITIMITRSGPATTYIAGLLILIQGLHLAVLFRMRRDVPAPTETIIPSDNTIATEPETAASFISDALVKIHAIKDSIREETIALITITASIEQAAQRADEIATASSAQGEGIILLRNLIQSLTDTAESLGNRIDEGVDFANSLADQALAGQDRLRKQSADILASLKNAEEIYGIISVIEDISDRINLLSLNAAIEAARAGESGRGFAVVADEIRKLADGTAASIRDISRMLKERLAELGKQADGLNETTAGVGRIMETMKTFSNEIRKTGRSVKDQGVLNGMVANQAVQISNQSEKIDEATTDQKLAIYEILNLSNGINNYIRETITIIADLERILAAGTSAGE